MSRSFDVLQRAERERQRRLETEEPSSPKLRADSPVYEALMDLGVVKAESSVADTLLGGEIVESVHPPATLNQSAREQVASLVKGLFLLPTSTTRAVTVAATEAGTKVAAITVCAAECLSNLSSKRVCVIDGDFGHPRLDRYFGLQSPLGLSEALKGEVSLHSVLARVSSNLWVLPAGASGGATSGLSIEALSEILVTLRREADYLLLQSPPLSDTNSAIVFANLTDGMAVVLEANRTRRDFARAVKTKLDAANVRVLGAVFNNRTYPIPQIIYSKL